MRGSEWDSNLHGHNAGKPTMDRWCLLTHPCNDFTFSCDYLNVTLSLEVGMKQELGEKSSSKRLDIIRYGKKVLPRVCVCPA